MRQIKCFDADGIPCGFISEGDAILLAGAGLGFLMKCRRGVIRRFVRTDRSTARPLFDAREGAIAMHHDASNTMQKVRADGSLKLGAGQLLPRLWKHKGGAC